MTRVRVSVLMPMYNGERYLSKAIDSILQQSYADFEFLIINDGSTDRSADIVHSYKDSRIVLVNNDTNLGVANTLNKGIELARGEYIARMDCDDSSFPLRLEKQVGFMDRNPNIGVCGTWIRVVQEKSSTIMRYPVDSASIRCHFLFYSALAHPSVLLRKSEFIKHSLRYDGAYKGAEDYELWVRAAQFVGLANLPEVLLNYRVHAGQATVKVGLHQRFEARAIRQRQLTSLGIEESPSVQSRHETIVARQVPHRKDDYRVAEDWLLHLKEQNERAGVYARDALAQILADRWFMICEDAAGSGWWPLRVYWKSPLKAGGGISWRQLAVLFAKCVVRHARRMMHTLRSS